jgi:hypothetical protein
VLGVAARVALAEEAGTEEPGNRQSEDQRYRCELPCPHDSIFRGCTRTILLPRYRLR